MAKALKASTYPGWEPLFEYDSKGNVTNVVDLYQFFNIDLFTSVTDIDRSSKKREILLDGHIGSADVTKMRQILDLGYQILSDSKSKKRYNSVFSRFYGNKAADALMRQAQMAEDSGSLEDAIGDYEKVASLDVEPELLVKAYRKQLKLFEKKGDTAGVKKSHERIVKQQPKTLGSLLKLAELYLTDKEYDKSIEKYNSIVTLFGVHVVPAYEGLMKSLNAEIPALGKVKQEAFAQRALARKKEEYDLLKEKQALEKAGNGARQASPRIDPQSLDEEVREALQEEVVSTEDDCVVISVSPGSEKTEPFTDCSDVLYIDDEGIPDQNFKVDIREDDPRHLYLSKDELSLCRKIDFLFQERIRDTEKINAAIELLSNQHPKSGEAYYYKALLAKKYQPPLREMESLKNTPHGLLSSFIEFWKASAPEIEPDKSPDLEKRVSAIRVALQNLDRSLSIRKENSKAWELKAELIDELIRSNLDLVQSYVPKLQEAKEYPVDLEALLELEKDEETALMIPDHSLPSVGDAASSAYDDIAEFISEKTGYAKRHLLRGFYPASEQDKLAKKDGDDAGDYSLASIAAETALAAALMAVYLPAGIPFLSEAALRFIHRFEVKGKAVGAPLFSPKMYGKEFLRWLQVRAAKKRAKDGNQSPTKEKFEI
ncbi:MAG: hypothetical protein WC471_05455 [Candidatus Woesearchaeota archaeon]